MIYDYDSWHIFSVVKEVEFVVVSDAFPHWFRIDNILLLNRWFTT